MGGPRNSTMGLAGWNDVLIISKSRDFSFATMGWNLLLLYFLTVYPGDVWAAFVAFLYLVAHVLNQAGQWNQRIEALERRGCIVWLNVQRLNYPYVMNGDHGPHVVELLETTGRKEEKKEESPWMVPEICRKLRVGWFQSHCKWPWLWRNKWDPGPTTNTRTGRVLVADPIRFSQHQQNLDDKTLAILGFNPGHSRPMLQEMSLTIIIPKKSSYIYIYINKYIYIFK